MCSFHSFNALKTHLSRYHIGHRVTQTTQNQEPLVFICPICLFKQPFSDITLFRHLRVHLKSHEVVECPYKNCQFKSNVYSSFNSHKSKNHQFHSSLDYKDGLVVSQGSDIPQYTHGIASDTTDNEPGPSDSLHVAEMQCDVNKLKCQLKLNLSSLFLKMQSILRVSDTTSQEIFQHMNQIFSLSRPIVKGTLRETLQKHNLAVSNYVLDELTEAVMNCNVVVSATSKGSELSTAKRRKIFVEKNYPLVMPVQYHLEMSGKKMVYVPILKMIQELFKTTDIFHKLQESVSLPGRCTSCCNGSYFQTNTLLSSGDFSLPLQLYIDDLEIANPLGTSKKNSQTMCCVLGVCQPSQ